MSAPDAEIPTRRRRVPGGMPQPERAADLQVVSSRGLASVPDAALVERDAPAAEPPTAASAAPGSTEARAVSGEDPAGTAAVAATVQAAANVEAAADATPAAPRAAPRTRPGRSRGKERRHAASFERTAPARDERRDSRTFRLYTPLYDELSALVRDLEGDGFRTDRTEILHALMYLHMPESPEAAEEMLRRFRKDQPD